MTITACPVYLGATYREIETRKLYVIVRLAHPHQQLHEHPIVVFQNKVGHSASDIDYYLSISEFQNRFEIIHKQG